MAHKRTRRARSTHKSFRIDPDTQGEITKHATATGWSQNRLVNRLLNTALDALGGSEAAGKRLAQVLDAARRLTAEQRATEKRLAPLRKAAAEARKNLRPLVQKITKLKRKEMLKSAA